MRRKKIVLVSHSIPEGVPAVVRLTEEAGAIVLALQRESGLSARSIVSQIIVQAADLVKCANGK